jgi:hypothetical protein
MVKKGYIKIVASSLFVLAFLITTPQFAEAASLYFSPSSGSYDVGTTLSVSVYISSANQAMNAASGLISFPTDKLQIISLSKTGSIFTLWVQEPSFSNSIGTVNFEGIVLNPGFTGSGGKIITMNFRVKAAGVSSLSFSSGSVLANDGSGTNILENSDNAQFSFGGVIPSVPRSTTPSSVADVPAAPQISSPTHPDPNAWYQQKNAKFTWQVPIGVTSIRLLVNKNASVTPTIVYGSTISEKEIADLTDGISYFHIQFRNTNGWGGISHFRFQIDTEKPSRFDISEISRKDLTEPKVKFIFDAKDATSGIDHYEIQIDNGSPEVWKDDGSHLYETIAIEPGKHTLIAKAVDKAGNLLANSEEFIVEALNSPTIIDYTKELQSGEPLIVHGSTYPNNKVIIGLQRENDDSKSFTTQSDLDGKFTFITDGRLTNGIYSLWAEVVDSRGAKSLPSEKITIAVAKSVIFRVGSWAVSFLAILVPLVALIVLLLFIVWYGWHKFSMFRKRLKKEVREAESTIHNTFDLLKDGIREQVKMLEKTKTKRELTEEEEKIIKQLKGHLDDAEKFVRKEIENIEKEIK